MPPIISIVTEVSLAQKSTCRQRLMPSLQPWNLQASGVSVPLQTLSSIWQWKQCQSRSTFMNARICLDVCMWRNACMHVCLCVRACGIGSSASRDPPHTCLSTHPRSLRCHRRTPRHCPPASSRPRTADCRAPPRRPGHWPRKIPAKLRRIRASPGSGPPAPWHSGGDRPR